MFEFVYKDIDFAHKIDAASNPTENYEKHIHYFNEIVLFVTGDVLYTVETETRKLQPGDIIFIPSGKYHFATVNSDAKYERYVLKFPDSYVPAYIKEKRNASSCFLGKCKISNACFLLHNLYLLTISSGSISCSKERFFNISFTAF